MTICVGKPIIQILARDGAWQSENGEALIAADELFHNDPYAEIERLTAVLQYISSLDDDGAAPVLASRALEHKP